MPFIPVFEEVAESELIAKVMVVVHRDMKAALDHWYASENLPDFAVMTDGTVDEFSYPLLSLALESGTSNELSSGEWLDQELKFGAALVVSGDTVKTVRAKAGKYVRALKAVIRKGVLEMLPDREGYLDYGIAFRWRYFVHGTKGALFTQAAQMEITITFGEK